MQSSISCPLLLTAEKPLCPIAWHCPRVSAHSGSERKKWQMHSMDVPFKSPRKFFFWTAVTIKFKIITMYLDHFHAPCMTPNITIETFFGICVRVDYRHLFCVWLVLKQDLATR